MAKVTPSSTPFQKEVTFTNYNHEQGKTYAKSRRNYDPSLYELVLKHHTDTGGKLGTLLDVGCGPGLATYTLAPHFERSIGIDPSDGMLSNAGEQYGTPYSSGSVQFAKSSAEELGSNLSPPIADASVDLITAANAAHWFNMEGFWPSAARVLKPGGTVAMWCSGHVRPDPSMPGAEAIRAAMDGVFAEMLAPYDVPGSKLTRDRYINLGLPWTLETPVAGFPEQEFYRREWQPGEKFYVGESETDLDTFEKAMGTGSAVTRWRQAHPDLVGTEQDVLRVLRRKLERILHEAGVEKGKEVLKGHVLGTLLMVKRRD